MAGDTPWWWLKDDELRALGLGVGRERSARGVVFGDRAGRLRLEVLPRTDEAPLRLGPVAVRVWGGASDDPEVVRLLHATARTLHARRATSASFDALPDELVGAPPASATPGARSEVETTVVDVPSRCRRACVFCGISRQERPRERGPVDDRSVLSAIASARGAVLLTGEDALEHPRILEHVRQARAHGPVSLVGPPRAGRERAMAAALRDAGLGRWSSGIFGPSDAAHDGIAAEPGALAALRDAVAGLQAAGIEVELITPLVTPLLGELAATTALGRALTGRPVTLQLYVPDPSVGLEFDALVPPWPALRAALDTLDPAHASLEGTPPCVAPAAMRPGGSRLSRTEDASVSFPPGPCDDCSLRSRCPGVARACLRAVGTAGLGERGG